MGVKGWEGAEGGQWEWGAVGVGEQGWIKWPQALLQCEDVHVSEDGVCG